VPRSAKKINKGKQEFLQQVRTAVADYMASEGCSCCRGHLHDEHAARLATLLNVPPYGDGSGHDFSQFKTESKRIK